MQMSGGLKLGVLALTLMAACGGSSTPTAVTTPTPPPTYTAYVLNEGDGTLTPIPLASGIPGTAFKIGEPLKVFGISIPKDGKTAYISGAGNLSVVDLKTQTVKSPIVVQPGISGPIDVAVTPDGKMAYAVNYGASTVIPVNLLTGTIGTPIAMETGPFGIAITPDGKTAYVVSDKSVNGVTMGSLTPIDLSTNKAQTPLRFPHGLGGIGMAPDGKTLWASYTLVDGSSNLIFTIAPISLPSGSLGVPQPTGFFFTGLSIAPDGKTAYLTTQFANGTVQSGVHTMDLLTGAIGTEFAAGAQPHTVVFGRDN